METRVNHSAWAVLDRTVNRLDGDCSHLIGRYYGKPPAEFGGCQKLLFKTKREARAFIVEKFGYMRTRPDLRREPHGWRMPRPVKVNVTVELAP